MGCTGSNGAPPRLFPPATQEREEYVFVWKSGGAEACSMGPSGLVTWQSMSACEVFSVRRRERTACTSLLPLVPASVAGQESVDDAVPNGRSDLLAGVSPSAIWTPGTPACATGGCYLDKAAHMACGRLDYSKGELGIKAKSGFTPFDHEIQTKGYAGVSLFFVGGDFDDLARLVKDKGMSLVSQSLPTPS